MYYVFNLKGKISAVVSDYEMKHSSEYRFEYSDMAGVFNRWEKQRCYVNENKEKLIIMYNKKGQITEVYMYNSVSKHPVQRNVYHDGKLLKIIQRSSMDRILYYFDDEEMLKSAYKYLGKWCHSSYEIFRDNQTYTEVHKGNDGIASVKTHRYIPGQSIL